MWEGPDTPTGDRRGTFTMVYDEGWEASFEALGPPHGGKPAVKFWGFLDWKVVNTTHVESLCGSVSYGTFHTAPSDASAAPTGWGCYKATKIEAPSPRVHPAPVMPTWTATAAGTYQPLPAPSLHREMPQAVADDRPDKIKFPVPPQTAGPASSAPAHEILAEPHGTSFGEAQASRSPPSRSLRLAAVPPLPPPTTPSLDVSAKTVPREEEAVAPNQPRD